MSPGPDGIGAVRQLRDAAEEVPPIAHDIAGEDPMPEEPPDDDQPQPDGRVWLPEGFPVIPLGVQGRICWFIDEQGRLQDFAWEKITRGNIEGLMGARPELLNDYWPRLSQRKNDDGELEFVTTGWKPEDAGRAFKAACAEKGSWSPQEKVRGRGTWAGLNGELIIHFGDRVLIYPPDPLLAIRSEPPGEIDGYVYPRMTPLMRPDAMREPRLGAPATILEDLQSWNWARPEVDPFLFLGQTAAGVLGGALKWRPLSWVTAPKGAGKSTLHHYNTGLMGDWLVASSDATAAGIWQKLGFDSRPVMIDEAEQDEENRRMPALLQLMRQAASGGVILRGGADHAGHEFTARSTFMASSIAVPGLNAADRSRMALLQLRLLPEGAIERDLGDRRMKALGRKLLRRLVDQWPRFAETLTLYRQAMQDAGHSGRGADVFGTLLACQDLVLFDQVPDSDTLRDWGEKLAVGSLAELAGDMPTERECLLQLLTQPLEAFRGGARSSVGDWVHQAGERDAIGPTERASDANKLLKLHGLEVREAAIDKTTRAPRVPGLFLYVAYRHVGLAKLFERSKWFTGTDKVGGWVQHLGWLPGAILNVPFWCGGQTKAVMLPYALCRPNESDFAGDSPPRPTSAAGRSPGPGDDTENDDGAATGRSAADTDPPFPAPDPSRP